MDTLSGWWASFSPASRLLVMDFGTAVIALFLGAILGGWARVRLKAFGVDEHLALPWIQPKKEIEEKPGAGDLFSYLVDTSCWILGGVVIANQHSNKAAADILMLVLGKAWALGLLTFLAAFLAKAITQASADILKHPVFRERLEALLPTRDAGSTPFFEVVTRGLGATVFAFLFLLVFLTIAEIMGLANLASAVAGLWNLCLKLLSVAAALLIGGLGVYSVARAMPASGKEASQEERIQGFTRLGIVAVTTILAVDLITSAATTFTWLAALFLLAAFLEPLRGSLLDIWAGFTLEFHAVKKVKIGENEMTLEKPGLLTSMLRDSHGESFQRQNREVLLAYFNAEKTLSPTLSIGKEINNP